MTIEKIILDSMKSAKDEIIEGVLDTFKTETKKPSTVKREEISGAKNQDSSENKSAGANGLGASAGVGVNNVNNISMINAQGRNRRLNIMIIGAALGLIFCLLILTSYKEDLPGEVVGIISTVSGIFGACLKDAYSFEFGSSRGSKEKDEKISSTLLERMKY